MTRRQRIGLGGLQGSQVSVSFSDGSRIDDCQLVNAGRSKLWLFVGGQDAFVDLDRITDVWGVS